MKQLVNDLRFFSTGSLSGKLKSKHLTGFKVSEQIEFREALPTTDPGKIFCR
ncbi:MULTISPECIES: hypothetical protein [unclassified Endozoicomonas]|nr:MULTISPECIES: hypothetical protein [unclassified Endozoicomonas]